MVNTGILGLGRCILLCEHERHIARLIQVNLKRAGHEVTVVCDVKSSIDLLTKAQFDVVVLDPDLPDKGGYFVRDWIWSRASMKYVEVVMLDKKNLKLPRLF